MRFGTFVLGLVLVLGLAAGALAAPGDPQKKLNAKDQAAARAMLLKVSDLPLTGWKTTPEPGTGPNPRCPGYSFDLSDLTETGSAPGFHYDRGVAEIDTAADVFVTEAQAEGAWKRVVKPGLARCFGEFVLKGLPNGKLVSASSLAFPPLGDASAAFRISFAVTAAQHSIPVHVDLLFIRRARALATLGFTQGLRPFAGAVERALATKVAARMPRS